MLVAYNIVLRNVLEVVSVEVKVVEDDVTEVVVDVDELKVDVVVDVAVLVDVPVTVVAVVVEVEVKTCRGPMFARAESLSENMLNIATPITNRVNVMSRLTFKSMPPNHEYRK